MEFFLIRRLSDKQFLCFGNRDEYYSEDIRNALMYNHEEHTHHIANTLTAEGTPCEVVYVTITISNVRG